MAQLSRQAKINQETPRTRRRRLVLALLAVGLLLQGLALKASEKPGWRLEEVLSIGGLQSDLLSMWVGLAVDGEGYIYLTDNVQCSLLKLDPKGNLVKKSGHRGQKPGEFTAPRRVDVQDKIVYVVDAGLAAVQVFDQELNFVRRIPLSYAVQDIQALPDGSLAVPGMILSRSEAGKVLVLDQAGRRLRSVTFRPAEKNTLLSMSKFVFAPSGEVFGALVWLDFIIKVNPQGKVEWQTSLLGIKQVKTKKTLFLSVPEAITYKDIALDPQGRPFVLGGHYSLHPQRDVYILSPGDGRRLATLTLPQASHCLYLDRQGFLYSRADNGMTLKKYKVIAPSNAP